MSVTTTSLSDSLPSSIPKLDATGLNWAIFSVHFEDVIQAKGFWGHFDGTSLCLQALPVKATDVDGNESTSPPSADELATVEQWEKDEQSAKSLLTQKIPNSTLMRVHNKCTILD